MTTPKTRVLRTTMFSPTLEPVSIVTRAKDLANPNAFQELERDVPGVLIVHDEFDIDGDASPERATIESFKRQQAHEEDERNLAIWYYWNAQHLSNLDPSGSLANPAPAPISAKLLRAGLRQLANHPDYRGQRVMCSSFPDKVVFMMKDGKVETSDFPN